MGQQKRRRHEGDNEPDQPCGAVTFHKWYSGPMCKNCYRRNQTGRRTQSKMAKTEDARTESGGDIPLVCPKVSAARCALPPIAPAPSPPGHCLLAPATCAVGTGYRSSHGRWWTGATRRLIRMMTRAINASSTTSTAGSNSSPTPMGCNASIVSGCSCTTWSRQKVGRRRF